MGDLHNLLRTNAINTILLIDFRLATRDAARLINQGSLKNIRDEKSRSGWAAARLEILSI